MFTFPVGFFHNQSNNQLLNGVKFLTYFQEENGNIIDLKGNTISKYGSPNILANHTKADSSTLQLIGNSSLVVDLALTSIFTIECFVWLFDTSFPQFLFGTYNITNVQSQALIFSTERLGNDQQFLTNINLPIQAWFHVAITFDSSNNIKLYIDGINQGSIIVSGLSYGTKFYIGGTPGDNNLGSWFVGNGYFDEFRISDFVRYTSDFEKYPYNIKYSL